MLHIFFFIRQHPRHISVTEPFSWIHDWTCNPGLPICMTTIIYWGLLSFASRCPSGVWRSGFWHNYIWNQFLGNIYLILNKLLEPQQWLGFLSLNHQPATNKIVRDNLMNGFHEMSCPMNIANHWNQDNGCSCYVIGNRVWYEKSRKSISLITPIFLLRDYKYWSENYITYIFDYIYILIILMFCKITNGLIVIRKHRNLTW